MKISIIIPVYNTEAYLRQCLDSVLAQVSSDLEIILVDDGSTDNSPQICDEYAQLVNSEKFIVNSGNGLKIGDRRLKNIQLHVIHQENQGQSVARNNGLDHATGDYVLFLDSDDYYSKGAIEFLTGLAKKNPEVDFFYMDCAVSTEGGRFYTLPHAKPVKMPLIGYYDYEYEQFGSTPQGCVCGGFYKREFIEKNNLRMLPNCRYEDELFIFEVFMKEGTCMAMHIEEPYYNYRIGREGATTAKYTPRHFYNRRTIVHACYKAMLDAGMQTEARKKKVFGLCEENLLQAYLSGFKREIPNFFNNEDVAILKACKTRERDKKLCKLASISPKLLAAYRADALPAFMRRCINRLV